ncbi:LysR family transcriptional regulator [Vibrio kyushuensis]|uniref:LysR family transcriptional regulator n=1 Tax=Vibrio kyushuensis TaxID=2910249 RepID=UPI003D10F1DC
MKQLDLNLLKVLRALLEQKNTKKAAEVLYLSQPAVSRSLSRLRDYFDDELFIRTSHGLEPTAKAEEIAGRLPMAMDLLYDAVNGGEVFDPSVYHGKVTIALNGFIAQWLAPEIITRIVKQAPNIELHLTNWESSTPDAIMDGHIHVGVNYFPLDLSKQLVQAKLGMDSFVVIGRKEHPLSSVTIEPEDFKTYPVASQLIPNWNEHQNRTAEGLKAFGITPKIQLRSAHLNIILDAINNTDIVFPCSERLANNISDEYKMWRISGKLEIPNGEFAAVISNKTRKHPLHSWLLSCIKECAKKAALKKL